MNKMSKFKMEKEEARFQDTHDSADSYSGDREVKAGFTRPKKNPVSLRLDEKTINELKKRRWQG